MDIQCCGFTGRGEANEARTYGEPLASFMATARALYTYAANDPHAGLN